MKRKEDLLKEIEKVAPSIVRNLSREHADYFKSGGRMTPKHEGGSGIHIKPENKGKFTDYCGGKVTQECISRGKNSSSSTIRKRATFAANARKWKHQKGGSIIHTLLGIPEGQKINFKKGAIPFRPLSSEKGGKVKPTLSVLDSNKDMAKRSLKRVKK